eukprot:COSAG01_NODE_2491_length_7583_cov_32.473944_5_plen_165_part_00
MKNRLQTDVERHMCCASLVSLSQRSGSIVFGQEQSKLWGRYDVCYRGAAAMRCRGSAWRLAAGARSLHASTLSLYRYSYAAVQSALSGLSTQLLRISDSVMYCVVPWLSTVRLVPVHPIDLFRYIHMSVGACLLDSETVRHRFQHAGEASAWCTQKSACIVRHW